MTTYLWTALTDGQIIAFNPVTDILRFNDASISASALAPSWDSTITGPFEVTFDDKTVTLTGVGPKKLTTNNVTFQDGSRLIFGDNNVATASDDLANTLTGGAGADRLYGLGGNDILNGGAGNDAFVTGYRTTSFGNDTVNGGSGTDRFQYNTNSTNPATVNLATHTATNAQGNTTLNSIETVRGTAANDVFTGGDVAHAVDSIGNRTTETFRGNGGNDTINGASGATLIAKSDFFTVADYAGNTGAQGITGSLATGVVADGLGATDTLTNVDALYGGDGADMLSGGSLSRAPNGIFFEVLRGNAGNDTLNGGNATSGGQDSSADRADYSTSVSAVTVNLATGVAIDGLGGTDTLIDIDHVYGGDGNDILTGDAGNNSLDGGVGNDTLNGGGGIDEARFQQSDAGVIVNLSAAAITVGAFTVGANRARDGLGGTDILNSMESVRGSDHNDHIRGSDNLAVQEFLSGDAGNDIINGGAGIDYASYANTALKRGGITAFLQNGSATVNDRLGGTDTLINIDGLNGTSSVDVLTGGAGNQWFRGRGGSDTINGGAGSDWASYGADPRGVSVNLAAGTAIDGWAGAGGVLGLGGTDTLSNIENAEGSEYADTLIGSAAANMLRGRAGNDTLNGGGGNDVLVGLAGADVLTGGLGADRFDFDAVGESGLLVTNRDRITDFNHAQGDRIDLSTIDANGVAAGNGAFTFIGGAAFIGNSTGKLRYDAAADILYGSIDADTAAEFSIKLTNITLVAGDFVL